MAGELVVGGRQEPLDLRKVLADEHDERREPAFVSPSHDSNGGPIARRYASTHVWSWISCKTCP